MTLRQTLALGAGWLCFARHIKEGGNATWQPQALGVLTSLHSVTVATAAASLPERIRGYTWTQALLLLLQSPPLHSPLAAARCYANRAPLYSSPGINTPVLLRAAASSRDEAAHRKPTDSGTEHKGEKHFCSHTYKGNQNGSFEKSLLGKPSLRDTNASGSSKYYGPLFMKRSSAAWRARSTLC